VPVCASADVTGACAHGCLYTLRSQSPTSILNPLCPTMFMSFRLCPTMYMSFRACAPPQLLPLYLLQSHATLCNLYPCRNLMQPLSPLQSHLMQPPSLLQSHASSAPPSIPPAILCNLSPSLPLSFPPLRFQMRAGHGQMGAGMARILA